MAADRSPAFHHAHRQFGTKPVQGQRDQPARKPAARDENIECPAHYRLLTRDRPGRKRDGTARQCFTSRLEAGRTQAIHRGACLG
ncbi:hypothetical protein [Croceicoccus sp. YJ47]|uniref:hypothetical protein n=1 Tax=Croceicoccus sp. YJ47 TaxID=2798724 RepID=UPI001F3ECFB9|nr:hypothetical protein [Croceicoccus sp. YJ47]